MMKQRRSLLALFTVMLMTGSFVVSGCSPNKFEEQPQPQQSEAGQTMADQLAVEIEGKAFSNKDVAFYGLMQQLKIEWARAAEMGSLSQVEQEDRQVYWDRQASQYQQSNIQLQTLIETEAMALLAREKHFFIPPEKLESEVNKFQEKVDGNQAAKAMIDEFGRQQVNAMLRPYLEASMLTNRIINELEKNIRTDQPNASDEEVKYETGKRYEDLFADQMKSIKLTIHLKE
ncbi:hypothetical protein BEP19_08480 [Ammoniphilus oxalaticus]|uniref:Lipoprotein n=1 Tax=Ammoniphilus oxalaticus TaxID=66863 RepID=A0A419SKB8_9BACL|nr:hypothetical protein [Ammoniphilus oxalaticus]RKD24415.1 hypothetical protein BEP19_08480 [Ammoniphilus oxalaticus]